MRYVFLALNWVFGVFFLINGVAWLFPPVLAGLAMLAIAFLLLPPVREFAYSKTKIELPSKARGIAVAILFIASGFFVVESASRNTTRGANEKAAALRQQNVDYFNQNTAQILGQIKQAVTGGDFNGAIALSSKYLASGDPELLELNAQANAGQYAAERRENTERIVAQLKDIPATALEENRSLYQQLVSLNPGVSKDAEKLPFYSDRIKQAEEKGARGARKNTKESEARPAAFGIAPVASGWDGSYLAVNRYLERVANDPDSIEIDGCTEVYTTDKGWLVGCNYRGRNAFGGMIRQSNWFTIVHDTVVQMHGASAYKQR